MPTSLPLSQLMTTSMPTQFLSNVEDNDSDDVDMDDAAFDIIIYNNSPTVLDGQGPTRIQIRDGRTGAQPVGRESSTIVAGLAPSPVSTSVGTICG